MASSLTILRVLVLLLAVAPGLQARPRVMSDAEMDEVCAKGSTGFEVDPVAVNRLVFEFSRPTSLGHVSANGTISVEVLPNASGRTVIMGPPITSPNGAPTSIQVVNGTVSIREDVTVNLETLPGMLRALQQNRLVLPAGFNPLSRPSLGMGGPH